MAALAQDWIDLCTFFQLPQAGQEFLRDQIGVTSPSSLRIELPTANFYDSWKQISKSAPTGQAGAQPPLPWKCYRCFHALRLYIEYADACGIEDDDDTICQVFNDQETLDSWKKRITEMQEIKQDSTELPVVPKLKTMSKWEPFKEMVEVTLKTQRNATLGHRLIYLIRDYENSTQEQMEEDYGSWDLAIEARVNLEGSLFDKDNTWFYTLLKGLVVDSEIYTYIKPFDKTQDGRGAWLALKGQAEGPVVTQNIVNQAYSRMQNSKYDGKSRKFDFEAYIRLHTKCHNELTGPNTGEVLSETKKVHDFLKGIKDPSLLPAVNAVKATDKIKSFEDTKKHLLAAWTEQKAYKTEDKYLVASAGTRQGSESSNTPNNHHPPRNNSFQARLAKAIKAVNDGNFKRTEKDVWTSNAFKSYKKKVEDKRKAKKGNNPSGGSSRVGAATTTPPDSAINAATKVAIDNAVKATVSSLLTNKTVRISSVSGTPNQEEDGKTPARGTPEELETARAASAGAQFGRLGNKKRPPEENPKVGSVKTMRRIVPSVVDLTQDPKEPPVLPSELRLQSGQDSGTLPDIRWKKQEVRLNSTISKIEYMVELKRKVNRCAIKGLRLRATGDEFKDFYEELLARGHTYNCLKLSYQDGTLGADNLAHEVKTWAYLQDIYKELTKGCAIGNPEALWYKAGWDASSYNSYDYVKKACLDAQTIYKSIDLHDPKESEVAPKGLLLYEYPKPKPKPGDDLVDTESEDEGMEAVDEDGKSTSEEEFFDANSDTESVSDE